MIPTDLTELVQNAALVLAPGALVTTVDFG